MIGRGANALGADQLKARHNALIMRVTRHHAGLCAAYLRLFAFNKTTDIGPMAGPTQNGEGTKH
jgi:hypothetical protein